MEKQKHDPTCNIKRKIRDLHRSRLNDVRHQTRLAKELDNLDPGSKRADNVRRQYEMYGARACHYQEYCEASERKLEEVEKEIEKREKAIEEKLRALAEKDTRKQEKRLRQHRKEGVGMESKEGEKEKEKIEVGETKKPEQDRKEGVGMEIKEGEKEMGNLLEEEKTPEQEIKEGGVYVKALFSYTADDETELTFQEGDIMLVTEEDDSGWWYAEKEGRHGVIPCNYIEKI